ncbi:MAG: Trm112 family protein [Thermoproteota archaeon]
MFEHGKLVCTNKKCNAEFPIIDGIPVMLSELTEDLKLTQKNGTKNMIWVIT